MIIFQLYFNDMKPNIADIFSEQCFPNSSAIGTSSNHKEYYTWVLIYVNYQQLWLVRDWGQYGSIYLQEPISTSLEWWSDI